EMPNIKIEKPVFLMLDNIHLLIFEKDNYYLLYKSNKKFYVVPKKDFSDAEILQMNEIFREKLGKRFS
ncbi:MAG TPA: YcxB family protein, partial [Clostridiales bacterium]|nr:YcxB family protein [Clostridiales bacterium]